MIELGSGRLVPGFEEQLEGAVGGEELHGHDHVPRRLRLRPSSPARRPSSPSRCARSRPSSCPTLNDELAEEAGFDTLDELREDIRSRMAEAETSAHRGRVPRGGAGRRGRGRDDRGAGRADRGAGPRDVGLDAALALAPGHRPRDLPADLRAHRGGDDRAGQAGRRAGAAPRGGAGRGGRGRVARADRGGDARGGRRGVAAGREDVSPRSCWSACATTGAWTASRTTCRSARRWTCSRSRPSRFRSPSSQIPDQHDAFTILVERPGSGPSPARC